MMNYEQPLISAEYQSLIRAFAKFEDTNFVKQVEFLGFDPKNDLMNLDLRGVDFSNCNLTGYNFSNSNLRGSFGVGTTWSPDTVNFEGADVDQSIFAHDLHQREFFKENPQHYETVERIASDYWVNTIFSVERLLSNAESDDAAVHIAHEVFHRVKNVSVRTDALLSLRRIAGREEHKEFIYSVFAKNSDDPGTILSALRNLSSMYRRDRSAFDWFIRFLKHPNQSVAQAAFEGVYMSPYLIPIAPDVLMFATGRADELNRKQFVRRVAALEQNNNTAALINWRTGEFYDFKREISMETLRRSADANMRETERAQGIKFAARSKNVADDAERWAGQILEFGARHSIPFKVEL
jgi:hypothetical protein